MDPNDGTVITEEGRNACMRDPTGAMICTLVFLCGMDTRVNVYIDMESHHFVTGKSTVSMAIFKFANCERLTEAINIRGGVSMTRGYLPIFFA